MSNIGPVELVLMLQSNTGGGFTHQAYLTKAAILLRQFGIGLKILDQRMPRLEMSEIVDPKNISDISGARRAAEKGIRGLDSVLRVIFCRFPMSPVYASTEGGAVRPLESDLHVREFTLIDVGKRRQDDCVLIHEMIHAAGLKVHDSDPDSVFSLGSNRKVLSREHAERLSRAFFARALS